MTDILQTPVTVQRDDVFYVDTITFKVEETLFRVPRWGFEHPECMFVAMFDLPGPGADGKQVEGTTDESPIILEGESKVHFKSFLKVLYPSLYSGIPKSRACYSPNSRRREDDIETFDEWLGVLNLSTKWHFTEIRKKAIQKASARIPSALSIWDKMALARKYNVKPWLLDEYRCLVLQKESHTVKALKPHMEISDILALLELREKEFADRCRKCNRGCYHCGQRYRDYNNVDEDVNQQILATFPSEFAYMQD